MNHSFEARKKQHMTNPTAEALAEIERDSKIEKRHEHRRLMDEVEEYNSDFKRDQDSGARE